jgi:hypothetical protein
MKLWLVLAMGFALGQAPAPSDYWVYGNIDTVTVGPTVAIGGWAFECRSGLQPGAQRQGAISFRWWRIVQPPFGESYEAPILAQTIPDRPDVRNVFISACPALGQNIGMNVLIDPPPENGTWHLSWTVTTTDSAGRMVDYTSDRVVVIP